MSKGIHTCEEACVQTLQVQVLLHSAAIGDYSAGAKLSPAPEALVPETVVHEWLTAAVEASRLMLAAVYLIFQTLSRWLKIA